ncbi:DUF167 domain-containing protein [Nakamurella flava]|uniref:UPF0235 protein FDO65_17460 n=1 Tax=Nakamurella flava TaxID=2576308 RepID=A0A4U6QBA5_9ACTN|nr:DUF167 domain-containing protein [Nakamurella flava]TKV57314.1 DUF167 domain-containing protein [Nakamurella flava]
MAADPAAWATVTVKVTPGSRKGPLVEVDPESGALTLIVRERAVDGKATAAAGELLAAHLGVRRGEVELVGGMTSRHKRFRVPAAAWAAVHADAVGPR